MRTNIDELLGKTVTVIIENEKKIVLYDENGNLMMRIDKVHDVVTTKDGTPFEYVGKERIDR